MQPSHHELLLLQLFIGINRKSVSLNASEAVESKEQSAEWIKQSSIIALYRLALQSAALNSTPIRHWLARHSFDNVGQMLPFVPLANDDPALSHSPLLKAAVLTHEYINEHGPIPLTPSKGLKRHFVHWAAQAFDWPGYTENDLFTANKVLNEIDFPPLMILHDILLGTKLARHFKGALHATKLGREMSSQPGELWPLLAEFLLCRIDFCHHRQPDEQLTGNWHVFLNVLNIEAHDAVSANQLCEILYGADQSGTEAREEGRNHRLSSPFYIQILRPLCWAGLLAQCAGGQRFGGDRQFVKTPLWSVALRLETHALLIDPTRH